MKMYRVLGLRGRITIPQEMRERVGFRYNDVISFTESNDGRSVIVTREELCDDCETYDDCGAYDGCNLCDDCRAALSGGHLDDDDDGDEIYEYDDELEFAKDFVTDMSPENQRELLVYLSRQI